ncbi:nuclear transport factor 2 family protein [Candidatus Thiosymbion oneisti]|uniref:nuclear transport factor 2 family protein n=1 Tax=Candidatus Thiosymbion oneisti TaxID=589554 RepID=UPI000B7FB27F|nr:nuclear transport factor 2 family protein [Candidatus Thiosymbion oneisti]
MSTETVINHHLQAFSAGDVDEIIKEYTEDSVLIVQDATLTGLDSIRAAFTGFFGGLFKPGTYEFKMDRMEISGDVAYVVWHSTNESVDVKLGTDTFLIRDGKIVVQTFAAFMQEK